MRLDAPKLAERSLRAVLALGVVCALATGGCSTVGDDSSADSTTEGESASSADVESNEGGSADDGVESELVIAGHAQTYSSLLTIAQPPPAYIQTLKECMNAQGFEFVTEEANRLISQSDLTALLDEVAGLNPTSSLFRNQYGYGITTVVAYLDAGMNRRDPNVDILAQMTRPEIEAWVTALNGPSMARLFGPEFAIDEEGTGGESGNVLAEPGGCAAEAESALELGRGMTPEESEVLAERLMEIESSEGYAMLEQEWASCASDQGFRGFSSIGSVGDLFLDKFEQLRQPESLSGVQLERVLGVTKAELDGLTSEEIEDRLDATPFHYTLEDLELLQRDELAFAHRLQDCDRAFWMGYAELEDRLFPDDG